MSADTRRRLPLWMMALIIIVAVVPLPALPQLVAACPAGGPEITFLRFYPLYIVVAAVCAWLSYARRPEVTWIIIVLMLMTHAAMWLLVDPVLEFMSL